MRLSICLILLLTWAQAFAAGSVNVSGNAVVYVIPDKLILTVGVDVHDKEAKSAQDENDRIVASARKICDEMKIPTKDVQTDCLSLEARYKNEHRREGFIGYVAINTMAITLSDVHLLSQLRNKLIAVGVNRIHGIQFKSKEFKKHREEARLMACKAAKEKAGKMLSVFGQQLGPVTSLTEGSGHYYQYYGNSWYGSRNNYNSAQNVSFDAGGDAGGDSGEGVALGKIAIRAQVSVQFGIVD